MTFTRSLFIYANVRRAAQSPAADAHPTIEEVRFGSRILYRNVRTSLISVGGLISNVDTPGTPRYDVPPLLRRNVGPQGPTGPTSYRGSFPSAPYYTTRNYTDVVCEITDAHIP